MSNVTKELTVLARKLGYEGKAPDTVAKAINAITSVADGDCDPGYKVVKIQLFSETVTTTDDYSSGSLAYSQLIDADTIIVTYDGIEYECPSISTGEYGAPWSNELNAYDFSEFPFNLYTSVGYAGLVTQTTGEHTVAAAIQTLQTTADFKAAVKEVANNLLPLKVVIGSTTWQEVYDAMNADRIAFVGSETSAQYVSRIGEYSITCISTNASNVIVSTYHAADANSPFFSD